MSAQEICSVLVEKHKSALEAKVESIKEESKKSSKDENEGEERRPTTGGRYSRKGTSIPAGGAQVYRGGVVPCA